MAVAFVVASVGCADILVDDILKKPNDSDRVAAIFFSNQGYITIRVFSIRGSNGGITMFDGGEVPEPVYLYPGKITVGYACSGGASVQADVLFVPRPGSYYLTCDEGKIVVRPRTLPQF